MKKSILCIVLVLCLCLTTMLIACIPVPVDEEPAADVPSTETPETPKDPETPNEPDAPAEEEGDKKGQFHPTPNAGGADVNINEPNEQLPDSTLRG